MSNTRYGAPPKCGGKHTTVRSNGRLINACYSGGAYIQLTFGSEGCNPSEVINVWDYEKGAPYKDDIDVRAEVREWIADLEGDGWDTWFKDYQENAR